MEFIVYLANTTLCAWVLYWCMIRTSAKPGSPVTGLFAWKPDPPPAQDPADARPNAPGPRRTTRF